MNSFFLFGWLFRNTCPGCSLRRQYLVRTKVQFIKSAANNEETTCSLKFTWSSCKKVCLLWNLFYVCNFSWWCLLFQRLTTKNFLSHLTTTSQSLHRNLPAEVVKNSFGYFWQICLTFTVEDLAILGILCFASYN